MGLGRHTSAVTAFRGTRQGKHVFMGCGRLMSILAATTKGLEWVCPKQHAHRCNLFHTVPLPGFKSGLDPSSHFHMYVLLKVVLTKVTKVTCYPNCTQDLPLHGGSYTISFNPCMRQRYNE